MMKLIGESMGGIARQNAEMNFRRNKKYLSFSLFPLHQNIHFEVFVVDFLYFSGPE